MASGTRNMLETQHRELVRARRTLQKCLEDIRRYEERGDMTMVELCKRHAHNCAEDLAERSTKWLRALMGEKGFAAWLAEADSGSGAKGGDAA